MGSKLQQIFMEGWGEGWTERLLAVLLELSSLVFISILAILAYKLAKKVLLKRILVLVRRTKTQWDDRLTHARLFHHLAHLIPIIVVKTLNPIFFTTGTLSFGALQTFVKMYLVVVTTVSISAVLDFVTVGVQQSRWGNKFPIKGVMQAAKLVTVIVAIILILAALLGQKPTSLLTGLGAMTAVLMLVFKDAILGFTAGIMLSANQLVNIGDWIEMPSAGADGSVLDVSLTTVRVQNFDKTIVSIPAYDLVSKSFKNWRGMVESGGRRIKRALYIDMQTVRFADEAMLEHWQRIELLRPYLEEKLQVLEESNQAVTGDLSILGNGRRLTNLGTFRAYCVAYLRQHPGISQNMLMIVRQLDPTEHGVPLELYTFTNRTDWVYYEGVQSDIFDHLLAIIGEFGLAIYQRYSDAATR